MPNIEKLFHFEKITTMGWGNNVCNGKIPQMQPLEGKVLSNDEIVVFNQNNMKYCLEHSKIKYHEFLIYREIQSSI